MEPDDLLCSRNAHDKNVLVGRAQWKLNQPPSPGEMASELGGIIERAQSGPNQTTPAKESERAWKEHF